jgi:preprotein translocase subunit SecD
MKGDAVQKFAALTTKINQTGGRLLIVLDNEPLFNGTVSTPITDGKGQMQGFKDVKDAQSTAVLLNAGALPVPVSLVEQRTVGASLGTESISKSLIAGLLGLW